MNGVTANAQRVSTAVCIALALALGTPAAAQDPRPPVRRNELAALDATLASLREARRDREALPIAERVVALHRSVMPRQPNGLAAALLTLGRLRRVTGDNAAALEPLREALSLLESLHGARHPDVATALGQFAAALVGLGRYDSALPLLERTLRLREELNGVVSLECASALNALAGTRRALGQFDEAIALYERALRIRETSLGPDHVEVASLLNNLARAHRDAGTYDRAVPLLERALHILESAARSEPGEVATVLNNLGAIYQRAGQYERALPLLERAVALREAARGAGHPEVATALHQLAATHFELGHFDEAVRLLARAVDLSVRTLGEAHPDVARHLRALAQVRCAAGDCDSAVASLDRALRISEAALGPSHPDVARILCERGRIAAAGGRAAEALPMLERALRVQESALGPDSLEIAATLEAMADALAAQGRNADAMERRERALEVQAHALQSLAGHQREEGLQQAIERRWRSGSAAISTAIRFPTDSRARVLGLRAALVFKARGEDESRAALASVRRSVGAEDRAAVERWVLLSRQLSALSRDGSPGQRQRLDEERRGLEEGLARRSAVIREQRGLAEVSMLDQRVARQLAPDAALIELAAYMAQDAPPNSMAPRRYAGFVLFGDGEGATVDLGDAASIERLGEDLLRVVSAPSGQIDEVERSGRAVWERLLAPIVRRLRPGIRRLVIAPDGPLHLVPLHLAHDGRGWLVDRFRVGYVTSGRDLLRARDPGVDTDPPTALMVTDYAVASWNLPGVRVQARLLPQLVPGIRVIAGDGATERAALALRAPRVLHVGAHGAFDRAGAAGDDPMRRGRLIFADARPDLRITPSGEDGIATAAELATVDLRGTRLVVLSACETARGVALDGRGVLGLRRAFLLAGAEALVTTMWSVDERAGLIFTVALYEALRAGMRTADAVANAMRAVRERVDPHPFVWAPFALVGRDDEIEFDFGGAPSIARSGRAR